MRRGRVVACRREMTQVVELKNIKEKLNKNYDIFEESQVLKKPRHDRVAT